MGGVISGRSHPSPKRVPTPTDVPSGNTKMQRTGINTRILPCDPRSITFQEGEEGCTPIITSDETLASLQAAASHLVQDLETVAFPTETVYGLGAVALNHDAVLRIFSTKGRPADNPLIVHVSSLSMLHRLLPEGYIIPQTYRTLMKAFWPGPLTLLFPANPSIIPSAVTAGHPTVAVRMPSHPVARALIALCDVPLAAPSANSSGRPSPTRAEHVFRDLTGKIPIILDGGPSDVGLESTVVDGLKEDGHLRVLRPGGVTVEDIERLFPLQKDDTAGISRSKCGPGEEVSVSGSSSVVRNVKVLVHKRDYADQTIEAAPTTPGMKYRHYAPSVPVILLINESSNTPPHPSLPSSASSASESDTSPSDSSRSINTISSLITSIVERFPSDNKITIGLLFTSDSPFSTPIANSIKQLGSDRISTQTHELGSRSTPEITARRLFDGLLTLDNDGADIILVESVEESREGLAVMNRVRKAAGETRRISLS